MNSWTIVITRREKRVPWQSFGSLKLQCRLSLFCIVRQVKAERATDLKHEQPLTKFIWKYMFFLLITEQIGNFSLLLGLLSLEKSTDAQYWSFSLSNVFWINRKWTESLKGVMTVPECAARTLLTLDVTDLPVVLDWKVTSVKWNIKTPQ